MWIHLSPGNLKMFHYYFFSLGIFNITLGFIFLGQSLMITTYYIFTFLYLASFGFSFYISWYMREKMRQRIIIESKRYFTIYSILTVSASSMTIGFWYIQRIQQIVDLTNIILGMNGAIIFTTTLIISFYKFKEGM